MRPSGAWTLGSPSCEDDDAPPHVVDTLGVEGEVGGVDAEGSPSVGVLTGLPCPVGVWCWRALQVRPMTVSRTGSITGPHDRAGGTKAFRIRWFDHEGKRRSEYVTGDRRTAERRLARRLQEAEEVRVGVRSPAAAAVPTLEQVALRADREVLPLRQRPRQQLRTLVMLRDWWAPLLQTPVDRIRPADIRAILATRRTAGRSPATCNRAVAALSVMLEAAREWGHCQVNPCRGIRLKEGRKAPRHLAASEARRLLTAALADTKSQAQWPLLFALCIYAGLRKTEATSLRWRDLDLVQGRIVVRDTKSGHDRVIPIHPELRAWLPTDPAGPDHLVLQGRARRGSATRNPESDQLVGAQKALTRALTAAGLQHRSIHDLRHTFASLAVQAGVDLETLRAALGHSTLAQTSRYVHSLGVAGAGLDRITLRDPKPSETE